MPEKRIRLDKFNPAHWDANRFKGKLENLGASYKIIGNGNHQPDLNLALDYVIHHDQCLSIIDFDGVVVHPLQTLIQSPLNVKQNGKMGMSNIMWLVRMAQQSARTIIWTSRFCVNDSLLKINFLRKLFSPFSDRIAFFPFLDQASITNLQRIGQDKLIVKSKKSWCQPAEEILKFCDQDYKNIVYVGSSHIDRSSSLKFLESFPDHAPNFTFFDTQHLFI